MDLEKLKNFDWRSLQKYTSPQASGDLNTFLEKLPQNTSQTLLVITAIAWAAAGVIGLYSTVQGQKLTELRAQLEEMEAVKPAVPTVKNNPVDKKAVQAFVARTEKMYPNLSFKANGSAIVIEAESTSFFGQFREAVGHVQNGGDGWRVDIERLCVGRECDRKPLAAALKINRVDISM